jgi:hypothetical protein
MDRKIAGETAIGSMLKKILTTRKNVIGVRGRGVRAFLISSLIAKKTCNLLQQIPCTRPLFSSID